MKIAEKSFKAEGVEFPAGSFVDHAAGRSRRGAGSGRGARADGCGAVGAAGRGDARRRCAAHRHVSRRGTARRRSAGCASRSTSSAFPYDLIYKERLKKGNLRADYDVLAAADAEPEPAGGVPAAGGEAGAVHEERRIQVPRDVRRVAGHHRRHWRRRRRRRSRSSSNAGGTLIAMGNAVRFPTEFGLARTVDASGVDVARSSTRRVRSSTRRSCGSTTPCSTATRSEIMPIKYLGGPLMSVGGARSGQRARTLRRRRRRRAERPDARRRRDPPAAVRRRCSRRLQRQGPGGAVRQQPDLPLAESRRVQHGVQRRAELERHAEVCRH